MSYISSKKSVDLVGSGFPTQINKPIDQRSRHLVAASVNNRILKPLANSQTT